jgi:hypothetical protein
VSPFGSSCTGSEAAAVPRFERRAPREQEPHCFKMPSARREDQRWRAFATLNCVRIRAVLEELRHRHGIAACGRKT